MAPPPLLSLRGVSLTLGDSRLFAGVDLHLQPGDKAALVGRNGAGKTTLFRLLTGALAPDAGDRFARPGVRIGVLSQEPPSPGLQTVAGYAGAGEVAEPHEVEAALHGLGLDPDRLANALSGGELRRAALARALVEGADVLLLDEPTNHLDIATIEWLEQTLKAYRGALLVVSHDRTFLRAVTNRMVWIDSRQLFVTDRGFVAFEDWQEEVAQAREAEAARMDQHLKAEERYRLRGVTARRRRNQRRLALLAELRAAVAARRSGLGTRTTIAATATGAGPKLVVEAEALDKRFAGAQGDVVIARGFSTRILRGDRVGVIGANGAGKTTLVRLLIGEERPDAGTVRRAEGLKIAYFDQRREQLDPRATPWKVLCPDGGDTVFVAGKPKHVVSYLKDYLFDERVANAQVSTLSGGERARLLLARKLAAPADLLVLDEPTNDLDMETLDVLEEALADYAGTLILVSHDRDFLDRLVTSTIAVEGDGRIDEYPGGYTDYLSQRQAAVPLAVATGRPKAEETRPRQAAAKLSYKEQRELDGLPEQIDALTAKLAALQQEMADPALFGRDQARYRTLVDAMTATGEALQRSETRWVELEEKRERLAAERAGG
ncbi:MAG: ATP-binding cassette domain-containing protein [Alphaproteobacteria bacterium]